MGRYRGVGRRAALNEAAIEQAYQLAANGQYDQVIIGLMGISTGTWYRWMKEGQLLLEDETYEPEQDYTEEMKELMAKLFYYVRKGQAEAEQKAASMVQQAGMSDWKAAAWYLERKYSARWGKAINIGEKDANGQSKLDKLIEVMQNATAMSEEEVAEVEEDNAYVPKPPKPEQATNDLPPETEED